MKYEFMKAKNSTPNSMFGPGKPWPTPRQYLLLVIHWIVGSATSGIAWFRSPANQQSSIDYVISETGRIVQMNDPKQSVAWHAGKSSWKDYPTYEANTNPEINPVNPETRRRRYADWNSLNPCSIGIELAGPPSRIGLLAWPELELRALVDLCKEIGVEYPGIKIIDHSRICSTKIDVIKGTGRPEDVFPWARIVSESGLEEA